MWQGLANYKIPLRIGVDDVIAGIEGRVTSAVDLFPRAYACESNASSIAYPVQK